MTASVDAISAKSVLDDCKRLTSDASAASQKAKEAVAAAKDATSQLAKRIDGIGDVIAATSSFDAQWEEFKRKFGELNKLMVERVGGMVGTSTPKRPAEIISEQRVAQVLSRASKVVVLTGAGISAESGIPTFRGADGFWTVGSANYRPEELATWEKFNEMSEELWRWYQYRWGICRKAKPNRGHHAIVELENLVEGDFTLVTQNIDGLHLEAGSDRQRLHEIHGRIDEMRCDERVEGACLHGLDLCDEKNFDKARATVVKTPMPAANEKDEPLPHCSVCGVRQRPKILWFDECYNEAIYKSQSVHNATKACDVLFVIGTQLTTGLPSRMISTALSSGAIIIKLDTIVDLADERSAGMLHLQGKSGEVLPRIISQLRKLRQEPSLAPLVELPPCSGNIDEIMVDGLSSSLLRPLQGSPATSLRRSSSTAKAKMAAAPVRNSGLGGKKQSGAAPLGNSSAARLPHSAIPRTPPQRSSGTLKSAGSAALSRGNNTHEKSIGICSIAEGFFVYGTLRPDDDSGATWTKAFSEGMESEVAFLSGASLYIDGSYPAVSLEQSPYSVRGVFMKPVTGTALSAKLVEADRIENYPDLYDRTVMAVHTSSGASRLAYVYHRTGRTDRTQCTRIADGDWLSRRRD